MDHLFFLCKVASLIWYKVLIWVGLPLPPLCSILGVFEVFQGFVKGKKTCLGLLSIWNLVVLII